MERPLMDAIENGCFETIRAVLESKNANYVNAKTVDGYSALHLLAELHVPLTEIVKVFFTHGADFNATDRLGRSPMDYAIVKKNVEAVKAFVLSGGVDVNSKCSISGLEKETLLHGACRMASLPIVKFLVKNGSNINALDDYDVTPLQRVIDTLICEDEDDELTIEVTEIVRFLLKRNPDVNTITVGGCNILTLPDPGDEEYFVHILWQLLVQHLAKLKAIGSPFHPSIVESIQKNTEFKNYFEKCNLELEVIKNHKLHPNNWVTFFNILVDDRRKLIQYAGNQDLAEHFTPENSLANKYEIYGDSIQEKLCKAIKYRKIWYQAAITLSDLLPISIDPEHNIVTMILSFLSKKDLKKLCDE